MRLPQAEKPKYEQDDNHCADDIDDAAHLTLLLL
jgi:hypothetical protein